jgi:hypothetical protein
MAKSSIFLFLPCGFVPNPSFLSSCLHYPREKATLLPLVGGESKLIENSGEDGQHHGRGRSVRDPHGEEGRRHHEPKHDPEYYALL